MYSDGLVGYVRTGAVVAFAEDIAIADQVGGHIVIAVAVVGAEIVAQLFDLDVEGFAVKDDPAVGQGLRGQEMTAEYMTFVDGQVTDTAGMGPGRKGFVVSNLHAADHALHIAEGMSGSGTEKRTLGWGIDLTGIYSGGIAATGAAPEAGSWSWMGRP